METMSIASVATCRVPSGEFMKKFTAEDELKALSLTEPTVLVYKAHCNGSDNFDGNHKLFLHDL